MSIVLFRCLGRAVLKNAPRALIGCLPFGETLYDVARDAMEEWRKTCRLAQDRRAELERLAQTTPDAVRDQAAAVAAEASRSPQERIALTGYLERLPGVVRRSLSRPEDMTGRTVPAGLPLERAEDLAPFLPPRPPRFRPGDRVSACEATPPPSLDLARPEDGLGPLPEAERGSRTEATPPPNPLPEAERGSKTEGNRRLASASGCLLPLSASGRGPSPSSGRARSRLGGGILDQCWELIELVGNGGFGEVWRARALHAPGETVAVKFCLDPAAVETLRTEAALLQRVQAEAATGGLVALRDACLLADPPFLVYDYIPGGDLTRLIRGWHPTGKRPARLNEEAARLVYCIAESLGVAHDLANPVVHRDLKPSNILLQPTRSGRVTPRVADFGIGGVAAQQALARLATTSQKERLTNGLRRAHTPLYASPQQIRGEAPDPRDDVYALGVIWYQVLTGDTTAGPPTDWRSELAEFDVAPAVLDVVGRCLASDPNRRPASAVAFADQVAPLLPALRPVGP